MRARMSWATIAALLLAAISVMVTLSLIDYPLGVAWDELVKLVGVSKGRYAYYSVHDRFGARRGARGAAARSAIWSACLAFWPAASWCSPPSTFRGSCSPTCRPWRRRRPPLWALLFIVHARLFKEDIFVAAFLVLALAALIRLLREPAPHRAILLGLLAGLAAGSKYIGLLILLFATLPSCSWQRRDPSGGG
jgi:hypothetical protein